MGVAGWSLLVACLALATSLGTLGWNEYARRRSGPWLVVEAFHAARIEQGTNVQITVVQLTNMGPTGARVHFLGFKAPDGGIFGFSEGEAQMGSRTAEPFGDPLRVTSPRASVEVYAGNHNVQPIECTPVAMYGNKTVQGRWTDPTPTNMFRMLG